MSHTVYLHIDDHMLLKVLQDMKVRETCEKKIVFGIMFLSSQRTNDKKKLYIGSSTCQYLPTFVFADHQRTHFTNISIAYP
jgi:hypothetical protein